MMKRALLFLSLLLAAPAATAQQTAAPAGAAPQPPRLTFEGVRWAGHAGYVGPVSGDITPHLVTGPGTRPGSGAFSRANRAANYGLESGLARLRQFDGYPFRMASVSVTNTGTQPVKSIRITFVFTDPATGEEVSRLDHSRVSRLKPGATADMGKAVRRSERSRRDESVISVRVRRVVYADGTVWRP